MRRSRRSIVVVFFFFFFTNKMVTSSPVIAVAHSLWLFIGGKIKVVEVSWVGLGLAHVEAKWRVFNH
jgi:hypothetical protein